MRKHYIDNLRSLAILLLFPVHTFMIWNDFGSRFYIWEGESRLLSTLIVLVNPWFMPLLFVLAGISARHALEKRTKKEFILERLRKLLLPFLIGLFFLVPFQTLYARKYFDRYQGGLFAHWAYFFTHITDFSGYDGAFSPGHLWFILYLFLISMVSLLMFQYLPYERLAGKMRKISVSVIVLLFLLVWAMYHLGNFGGFSLGKNLILYLLGYYLLSQDEVIEKLEQQKIRLLELCIPGTVLSVILYARFSYYGDLWVNFIGWISILVLLPFGKQFLNKQTGFTDSMRRTSYSVYMLHQTILIVLAYYVVQHCESMPVQVLTICIGSFLLTYASSAVICTYHSRLKSSSKSM